MGGSEHLLPYSRQEDFLEEVPSGSQGTSKGSLAGAEKNSFLG